MANSYWKPPAAIVTNLMILVLLVCLHTSDAEIGACYGTIGDNLPPPAEVITLCVQNNIRRIRLYDPNPAILTALDQGNQNISVIVGVPNEEITGIAQNALLAQSWIQNHILKYPNVNFKYIAVGNEIITPYVNLAMQNIHYAISLTGLRTKVKVSTSLSLGLVLEQSYPPSAGTFKSEIQNSFIGPLINFLVNTEGPFLVNVYPYFAYVDNIGDVSLDYALFTSPSAVIQDGPYGYQNLFDAMVDAARAALEKAGGVNLEIVVTETGWPSEGGTAASVDNARAYNSNLVKNAGKGTPRKPGKEVETYIFDLIDENLKSPEIEKHWGLFLANKQPKYLLS